MDLNHVRFEGSPSAVGRTGRQSPSPLSLWSASAAPGRGQRALTTADDQPPVLTGLPLLVLEGAGLDSTFYREAPLRRRTASCLRALKAGSEAAARARLESRPELLGMALSTMLIGVSSFFRDQVVFEAIRAAVIPALAERSRLRILSVGCSSGEELYSVAMLLAEAGLIERSELLGIDCRADAIAAARSGAFNLADVAVLEPQLQTRYFDPGMVTRRVAAAIRNGVNWQVQDATRQLPDGEWDVVLCRNVTIYLQDVAAESLMTRIVGQLAPGGFVVVGKAERPPAGLNLTAIGSCVFRANAR